MALFRYKAVTAAGDVAAGEIEAANEAEIVDLLRDQGLMPTRVEAASVAAESERGNVNEPSKRVSNGSWHVRSNATRCSA